jgi:hypothetical protein
MLTLPSYSFDLNACEIENLLTIKGLQKKEVLKIIEYRKKNGFFNSLHQIKEIEGISKSSIQLILNSEYDEDYVNGLSMPELNFMALLTAPLKHLIFYIMGYFLVIIVFIYFFFLRKESPSIKRILSLSVIYLLQWILFVLSGLIFVVLSNSPWQLLILLIVFFMLLNVLRYRKIKVKRNRSLFATCLMGLLLLISLI